MNGNVFLHGFPELNKSDIINKYLEDFESTKAHSISIKNNNDFQSIDAIARLDDATLIVSSKSNHQFDESIKYIVAQIKQHVRKYNRKKLNNLKKGFSLLELAIVIAVSTMIAVGSLKAMQGTVSAAKNKLNNQKIQAIQDALQTYFQRYERMPCPARPSSINTDAIYLKEDYDSVNYNCRITIPETNTNPLVAGSLPRAFLAANQTTNGASYLRYSTYNLFGIIPVRDLGLPDDYAYDSNGNAFTYVVSSIATINGRGPNGSSYLPYLNGSTLTYQPVQGYIVRASFKQNEAGTDAGGVAVNNYSYFFVDAANGKSALTPLARTGIFDASNYIDSGRDSIMYYLIYHGEDGSGAWNKSGTINPLRSTGSDNIYPIQNQNSYLYYYNACGASASCTMRYNTTNLGNNNVAINKLLITKSATSGFFDAKVTYKTIDQIITDNSLMGVIYCHTSTIPQCAARCTQYGVENIALTTNCSNAMHYISSSVPLAIQAANGSSISGANMTTMCNIGSIFGGQKTFTCNMGGNFIG